MADSSSKSFRTNAGTSSLSQSSSSTSSSTDTQPVCSVRTRSQTKASTSQIEEKCLPPKKRHSSQNPTNSVFDDLKKKQKKGLKLSHKRENPSKSSSQEASNESPPKRTRVEDSKPSVKVETQPPAIDLTNPSESSATAAKVEFGSKDFNSRKRSKQSGSRIGSIVSKSSDRHPGPNPGVTTGSTSASSSSARGASSAGTSASGSASSRRRSSRLSNKSGSHQASSAIETASTSEAQSNKSPTIPEPGSSAAGSSSGLKIITVSTSAMEPTEASGGGIGNAGASAGAGGNPSSSGTSSGTGDETDESEMGRLQALLEARGLPPHIFGVLGPRMQHLLHRSIGSNSSTKAHELLKLITAPGADEGQQLQAVMEMCQLLVMGNEDTLAGFPVKQAVPALKTLLQMEHNFDIMNHAVRALTYMMESLPRSSAVVVEAVPVILEKLQAIQCMDVAEQSLTALEMLSRRHSKNILHAKGVSSCLMYIDFFSINAQRAALAITANCFQNLTPDEFVLVKDSLQVLSNHLNSSDKKSVESICLAFSRIVDCFSTNAAIITEVASFGLLNNLQQLLVITPPIISTGTFVTVIRMMATMCATCPQLAVDLLKLDIAGTLRSLLLNPQSKDDDIELASRSPQELYELVSLISELMPRLPSTGIFSVDALLNKSMAPPLESITWEWQDDRGLWHPYSCLDSKVIESAHETGEDETNLSTMGRIYVIDFNSMQQINEESGTSRPIQRKLNSGMDLCGNNSNNAKDPRSVCLEEDPILAQSLVRSLFGLLYEVYSSSAGPSVRQKCLRALLRIIHYSSSDLLECVLKNHSVSRHISAMLASPDLRIVVGSLQMANILIEKLPKVFSIYFRREGVVHQISKLTKLEPESPHPKVPISISAPNPVISVTSGMDIQSQVAAVVAEAERNLESAEASAAAAVDSVMMDYGLTPAGNWSMSVPPPYEMSPSVPSLVNAEMDAPLFVPDLGFDPNASTAIATLPPPVSSLPSSSSQSPAQRPVRSKSDKSRKGRKNRGNPQLVSRSLSSTSSSPTISGTDPISVPLPNVSHFSGPCTSSTSGLSLITTQNPVTELRSADHHSTSASASLPNDGSSRRRFVGKMASSTSSFLASLHPGRWSRWSSSNPSASSNSIAANVAPPPSSASSTASVITGHRGISAFSSRDPFNLPCSSVSSMYSSRTNPYNNGNRDKIRIWIRDEAIKFQEKYFSNQSDDNADTKSDHPALNTLNRLNGAVESLGSSNEHIKSLEELKNVLVSGDISPFELIHSGVVHQLLLFLTKNEDNKRDDRIRNFLHVFIGSPINKIDPLINLTKEKKLSPNDSTPLSVLVMKLNACVSQLEQFPVRVHDVIGTGVGNIRGTSALKFFNTHQLKVNLQRHPYCTNLKQWRGGPVKIDPLALVQAIERYLVLRGYGRVREEDEEGSDDDNSDEEFDDNVAAMMLNQGTGRHRLQFFIGDHALPYNMTIYQAIRQFSANSDAHGNEIMDIDADSVGNANLWVQTHAIHYKPFNENVPAASGSTSRSVLSSGSAASASGSSAPSTKRGGKGKRGTSPKRKDELWTEGKVPNIVSPVEKMIETKLPSTVTGNDSSYEAISLLRILHALNQHWNWFYSPSRLSKPAIPMSDFINVKLTSKVNRQLQDPLVIMTGNLPPWLSALAYSCPFLFPFETRHLLFYVTCFDRDRALQRLIDSTPGMNSSDTTDRVTPRLDRRKKTVSREDLLRQAESVLQDVGNSKSLLEIQYENEVGTGLGPTLEFYSLVSQELQRADQEMWRGEIVSSTSMASKAVMSIKSRSSNHEIEPVIKTQSHKHVDVHDKNQIKYMFSPSGLFPVPLARNVKSATLTKIKNRYKLLGKFMAKALMDSRMIDIPLSVTFYKWLLGKQSHLSLLDMEQVDSALSKSLNEMEFISKRKTFLQDQKSSGESKELSPETQLKLSSLTLDGCSIDDLGLDFTLPGFPSIELKKGGKDTPVTLDNIEQYLSLLCHWTLFEGVAKQMESFKEGFESIFPLSHLSLFYPDELEQLFCGSGNNKWDTKTLSESCHADHGYNMDSRAIKFLFEILSNYDCEEQRKFLQFVTGSPRLPVGGLKSLSPPLTIVRKTNDTGDIADDYLPSVMTCVNYLKLPDYSSIEVMKMKLKLAAEEGQNSFHLS